MRPTRFYIGLRKYIAALWPFPGSCVYTDLDALVRGSLEYGLHSNQNQFKRFTASCALSVKAQLNRNGV